MIPFFRPSITDADVEAVEEVMRSGWLTSGAKVIEFEERMAEYLGAKYVVATSSCTVALEIALRWADARARGRLQAITTPLTFTATAEAISRAGIPMVFADTEPDGVNISPETVSRIKYHKNQMVVPVGVGGNPADLSGFANRSKTEKLLIIEDAAHTLGATIRAKPTHAYAEVSCYSFHANKNLTTNGEGGMIVTDHWPVAAYFRRIRQHGMDETSWGCRDDTWDYDVGTGGQKANMPDVCAAMGLTQLARFDDMQAKRKYLCWGYHHILREISDVDEDITPFTVIDDIESSACHLYQVLLPEWMDRDRVFRFMADKGVRCGVHYKPLYQMTAWQEDPRKYPNCEKTWTRLLSLPLFVDMTSAQQDLVGTRLLDALKKEKELCGRQLACVS